ncbi:MAG: cation-binding protein [Asticcacaulis sp. 32-58-5]|nr:MAG: cation-binding protein [Asticcacaulis sp. 32-58-5]
MEHVHITGIERLPDSLVREPLNWLFAEHYRHRQLCKMIEGMANSASYDDETMLEVINFLTTDMPLHVLDEEDDLFPLLRRRAQPDDDLEHVLGVLGREHKTDDVLIERVLSGLIKAQKNRKAPSLDPSLRQLLIDFVAYERRHIALENAVVLPIARLRLNLSDLQALSARFAARRGRMIVDSADD